MGIHVYPCPPVTGCTFKVSLWEAHLCGLEEGGLCGAGGTKAALGAGPCPVLP